MATNPIRTESVASTALACPRDGAPLAAVTRDGVVVDVCGSCRGAWFDAKELVRAAGERGIEKMARPGIFSPPSAFPCPRCGGECARGFVIDVEVDVCRGCSGVWLDGGELAEAKRQLKTERLLSSASVGFRQFLRRI